MTGRKVLKCEVPDLVAKVRIRRGFSVDPGGGAAAAAAAVDRADGLEGLETMEEVEKEWDWEGMERRRGKWARARRNWDMVCRGAVVSVS